MHKCHMIMDFQFGSTGKGLLAGYLAKREDYDTAVCAFATNAGHTYIDEARGIHVMTQQLPTAITSPTVKNVLIGPGSLIHVPTFMAEIHRYAEFLVGKNVMVHPHAAIVEDYHMRHEIQRGMSRIGSTTKGVGAAAVERIERNTDRPNIAKYRGTAEFQKYVTSTGEYRRALMGSESMIVEGAQGFSLSMYHGFYPFTTSRDVTPWQVAADCGLPFKWANQIQVMGCLRTFPIRVNNRDGSSGPHYYDQEELNWNDLGVDVQPELTTVTKLPRRIFSFSKEQLQEAIWHCGSYWETKLFLNFANYMGSSIALTELIEDIERPDPVNLNPPKVAWLGWGPDDSNVEPT